MSLTPQDLAKKKAGYEVAEIIKSGIDLGIGTGSTVFYLIEALISKQNTLKLKLAFSSEKSKTLMKASSFEKYEDENFKSLDMTIDGADYFDQNGVMIKGGGGALTREKILISCSKKVIILVDETKFVKVSKK